VADDGPDLFRRDAAREKVMLTGPTVGPEQWMQKQRTTTCSASEAAPRQVIDFERYLPTVLSRVMGRLRSSANEFFGKQYGISLLEWRIVSFVAAQGPSSAYSIWTEGALDKAAVTRALRGLRERGLVAVQDVAGQKRRKTAVTLTPAGMALHEATFGEVVIRHQRLLHGLSTEAVEQFMATISHMERQIGAMSDGPTEPGPAFLPTKAVADTRPPADSTFRARRVKP